MEEHAMTGQGKRERTDLHQLLDQIVSLTSARVVAARPDLVITVDRQYDDMVGALTVVPQEIGRVFANMLNNAFEAIADREPGGDAIESPRVVVATRMHETQAEIRISDNGPGILAANRLRVFEPFFTTKSTGDGHTGLGLSLSYDIVTRGHGGTLHLEDTGTRGATFVMRLPTSNPG
jgi:two-component system, NtrC family, sensor kinase